MKVFNEFVGGSGKVEEWNPRIFISRLRGPMDEVLIAMADFAAVEDRINRMGGYMRK